MKKAITLFLFTCLGWSLFAQVGLLLTEDAGPTLQLAAKEVRKYVYLRTDVLVSLEAVSALPESGDWIVVADHGHALLDGLRESIDYQPTEGVFFLKSLDQNGRQLLILSGADSLATLRAAYRFAEHLGVAFDLSGDVIPDARIPLDLSGIDEAGRPLFDIQGIQPFHDFHQGPDLWSTDDYRTVISQLPKLGMNFIGFHTYARYSNTEEKDADVPQGPEPNVWIGLPEDVNADGTVKRSYPAFYAHTHRPDRIWGSARLNTDQFHAGAQRLFARNEYGSEVFDAGIPDDEVSSNEVFNRVGKVFERSFSHARRLGVKTAIGTELTLGQEPEGPEVGYHWIRVMPESVQQQLRQKGIEPETRPGLRAVYRGIFERIMKTHPLDYYWLWSWEVWSNYGVSEEQIHAFKSEMELAQEVLNDLGNPFQLGLAGWKIGTVDNHAEFDNTLPPEAPFFGLWDQAEGMEDLKPERVKWAGTWPEEDWGLLQPQLELHRFYKDVKAALEKNCHGLIAKHWRTRILGANLYSLKDIQWVYGPTGSLLERSIPKEEAQWIDAFYLDWATRNFGRGAAKEIARILAGLDKAGEPGEPGAMPVVTEWDTDDIESSNPAPGAIMSKETPWEEEKVKYAFVAQLESLRPRIQGAGNLDRFDYWLKSMQAIRLMAEYGTLRYPFEEQMNEGNFTQALVLRKQMARLFERIMTLQIEKAVNESDLGEILNLEILNWYQLMQLRWDEALEKGLGQAIPADANPTKDYSGKPFIKATPVQTQIYRGEDYRLKVWVMGELEEPTLYWRPLGSGPYRSVPISHVARSVYEVVIPEPQEDFEFYLEATGGDGKAVFPASAPKVNAAVIVLDAGLSTETAEPDFRSGQLRVFPNPARDAFTLETSDHSVFGRELRMQLLDAGGQVVLERRGSLDGGASTFSLPESLPTGTYTLRVEVGKTTYREKFVIAR